MSAAPDLVVIDGLDAPGLAVRARTAQRSCLPFFTDSDPVADRRSRILALARSHGLSGYDATYLELAQRLGAALFADP